MNDQQHCRADALTDAQILDVLKNVHPNAVRLPPGWLEFARAILAASPVEQPAAAPADERAAQNKGYFVYDPEGNGFELYATDAERAEAHNTAIKECRQEAIDDGEWPLEVESIVSGIVTHLTVATQVDGDSCDYEARAAASPTAEVVRLEHVATAEDGGKLRWMTGRRPRDCELYARPDGGRVPATLYATPQPAQAASPGAEEMRDAAMRTVQAMGLVYTPGSDRWRPNAASQPAQADAPAHAAECPHCDGEGVIEGDSGTSPCACQRDAQEGMPTFGARRAQADAPAEARERIPGERKVLASILRGMCEGGTAPSDIDIYADDYSAPDGDVFVLRAAELLDACAPADAGEAALFGWAQPKGGNYFTRNESSAKRIGGLIPVYTAPLAARVASLTKSHRAELLKIADDLATEGDENLAKVLRSLLNGADHDL
ncbi:hypothetical protein NCM_00853 [Burkholderia pseudomallei]